MDDDGLFWKIGPPIMLVFGFGMIMFLEFHTRVPMAQLRNAVFRLENSYSADDALPSTSKELLPIVEQTDRLLKRLGAHKDKLEGRMEFLLLYKENKPLKKAQTKRKGTGKNNQLRTGL